MRYRIIALMLLMLTGCSSNNLNTKQENRVKLDVNIEWGAGGGFTGLYNGYLINTYGIVSRWNGRSIESANIKVVDSLTSDKIFLLNNLITDLKILTSDFDQPADHSSFIRLYTDSIDHKIVWAGNTYGDLPNNIKEFQKELNTLVQSE